jgi:hypothetical protein
MENLYYFDVPAGAPGFTVTLTATYGDPDIYINLDPSLTPTSTSAQYKALSSLTEDSISINASDVNFVNCVNVSFPDHARCRAFIGVYGFRASQYSLVASLINAYTQLQESIPVSGTVNPGTYTYYTFTTQTADTYVFTATPISGDPDMYISNNVSLRDGGASLPTLQNHMWFSNGLNNESVTLNPSDPRVSSCPLPCTYFIGMTGFIRPAAFQLIVSRPNSNLVRHPPRLSCRPPPPPILTPRQRPALRCAPVCSCRACTPAHLLH